VRPEEGHAQGVPRIQIRSRHSTLFRGGGFESGKEADSPRGDADDPGGVRNHPERLKRERETLSKGSHPAHHKLPEGDTALLEEKEV